MPFPFEFLVPSMFSAVLMVEMYFSEEGERI
jgi:hypothetical protein